MKNLSFTQFQESLQAIPGWEFGDRKINGFAPYLAFAVVWASFHWTQGLSSWDKTLNFKVRPWIYLGVFLLLMALILLPQWMPVKPEKTALATQVLSIPLIPIEPTLVPDTLFIPTSLNQHSHEK